MNIRSHAPTILTAGGYGMRCACAGSGCTSSSLCDLFSAVTAALLAQTPASNAGGERLAPVIAGTGEIARGQPLDGLGGAEEVGIAAPPRLVSELGQRR